MMRRLAFLLIAPVLAGLLAAPAPAAGLSVAAEATAPVAPDPSTAARLFGIAGPVRVERLDDAPPAWRATGPEGPLGLIASTWEIAASVGYSGRPLDVLVAVTPDARIAGAQLIRHAEPILTLGISDADIAAYVARFAGLDLTRPAVRAFEARDDLPPVIARATVSTGVIRDAVLRTARTVALGRGLIADAAGGVDRASFREAGWADLAAEGAIAGASVSMTQAAAALAGAARPPTPGDGSFIDLWVALIDPPTIGRNLLGQQGFTAAVGSLGPGDAALLVASRGAHSHRGTRWRRDGWFDRIEIAQGDRSFRLSAEDFLRVDRLAAPDAPELTERSVFRLRAADGFRPAEPFRVTVRADRPAADGSPVPFAVSVDYALPEAFRAAPPADPFEPLWISAWERRRVEVIGLGAMLGALYLILILQEPFVRRPRLWRAVRLGFLSVTTVVLGWALGAQLSVVQVVAFIQSLLTGFWWETFLIEPLIFMLWGFTALGLLFVGRGVYCGWLCPFGALQELTNAAARRLGVPQIAVPHVAQERLWALKYVAFVAILGLSLHSMDLALRAAEIEPFKTAVSMRFDRAWPFVLFAVGLLAAGLFIERFYCRYLCPLGAALAIPAKIKLFDWLHRRPQCGRECRLCEQKCTVGAIDPLGRINPNECVLCLRCQVVMHDPAQCTVLKGRAARMARMGGPA